MTDSTDRPPGLGSPAPDFTLAAADGAFVTLSGHRGRESVVLYFLRAFT